MFIYFFLFSILLVKRRVEALGDRCGSNVPGVLRDIIVFSLILFP